MQITLKMCTKIRQFLFLQLHFLKYEPHFLYTHQFYAQLCDTLTYSQTFVITRFSQALQQLASKLPFRINTLNRRLDLNSYYHMIYWTHSPTAFVFLVFFIINLFFPRKTNLQGNLNNFIGFTSNIQGSKNTLRT